MLEFYSYRFRIMFCFYFRLRHHKSIEHEDLKNIYSMNHDHYLEAIGDYVEQQLVTMWNALKIMRNRPLQPMHKKANFLFLSLTFYTKNCN